MQPHEGFTYICGWVNKWLEGWVGEWVRVIVCGEGGGGGDCVGGLIVWGDSDG